MRRRLSCMAKRHERLLALIVIMCAIIPAADAKSHIKWNSAYQEYIDKYKDLAIDQMNKYGIPASITLAQGVFESGAGKSSLTRKSNNHFGIKCHSDWKGKKVYFDDDARGECFRAYKNAKESYEDHSRFLSTGRRYRRLFELKTTDYKGWAKGLKAAGYATNPQYAKRLIEIIELYDLDKYDRAKKSRKKKKGGYEIVAEQHRVYAKNDNYYVIARKGDTFRSIGEETGVSYRKIAKYNERDKDDTLREGEIIYLEEKAKRADKSYEGIVHYVEPGESMYSIAQQFGIKVEYLYRLNNLPPYYDIQVGDALRLR